MTLYVVTGRPLSGKTQWVHEHAKPGDVVIDYDRLAAALTHPDQPDHDITENVARVAMDARDAAIDRAIRSCASSDVYIVHARPTVQRLRQYHQFSAVFVNLDTPADVCLSRLASRPESVRDKTRASIMEW